MVRRWLGLLVLMMLVGCAAPAMQSGPPALKSLIGTTVAGSVTHAHVCSALATPSTTDIDCPDWNDSHVFGGTAAVNGAVPFYDTGETTHLNWSSKILYDETTSSLKLFSGGVGSSGVNILSLGCGTSANPSTQPADSVQVWCHDVSGAGTAGLVVRDEMAGFLEFGSTAVDATHIQVGSSGSSWYLTAGSAIVTLEASGGAALLEFRLNTLLGLSLTSDLNAGVNTNTFGTGATKVLAVALGTCPTAAFPADQATFCVQDRNGAGTASWYKVDEEGRTESFAGFVNARSTGEGTTVNSAVDLRVLTTSIAVDDGAKVRVAFRKMSGAVGTGSIGVKVNTVQIIPNTVITTSENQSGSGVCEFLIWARNANHLRPMGGTCWFSSAGTPLATQLLPTADMTAASITAITITGTSNSASITIGVRDVVVERLAGN